MMFLERLIVKFMLIISTPTAWVGLLLFPENGPNAFILKVNRKRHKESYLMIFSSNINFHYNLHLSNWPPHFQIALRCKTDLGSVGKMYIFVKVCLGSSYSIAVPDCNDTSSLEACNCIIRANSPVFTTFYFRFRHWAFWTKLIATTRLKTFQYRLVWTCIHKKLIACHSPNFKICVGSRIILPVTLLQPTKTDDRKRSNWPPDVNQIVFHWPPRRSIWKFTARV